MKISRFLAAGVAALALAQAGCQTQQVQPAPTTEGDDIVGVVTGAKGPEAGVWVIAQTDDLQTRFYKIVVTDDQGRYAIPDLPFATYSVWVRGYGLQDSRAARATPGSTLELTAGREASPRRRRRSIRRCTGSRCSRCRRRASSRSGRCRASSSG